MSIDSNIEHLLAVTLPNHYGSPTRRNQKVRQQEGVQHLAHRPSSYPRFPLPLAAEVVVVVEAVVAVVAAVAAPLVVVVAAQVVAPAWRKPLNQRPIGHIWQYKI
jgi:hypothetical protein